MKKKPIFSHSDESNPLNLSKDIPGVIYPCTFSKSYYIPAEQAWLLLKVYSLYRILLAVVFITLFETHIGPTILGSYDKQVFRYSCYLYLTLNLISAICIYFKLVNYRAQSQAVIFTDIILLTFIIHSCGGLSSGLGILLAVSVAAGGLLVGGLCAMVFAAIATLTILAEQIYAVQVNSFEKTSFTYAGMLGASYFTIAFLSYVLAQRTEQSEALVNQHKQTIYQLEELNRYIIQHLQSGIIITDQYQKILMTNEAASKLLQLETMPDQLQSISTNLSEAFSVWLTDQDSNFVLLQLSLSGRGTQSKEKIQISSLSAQTNIAEQTSVLDNISMSDEQETEIQVRFMLLPTHNKTFHMVILENISLYNQRLQQSKLASLGQLTASIAHEIRNPLGAISHAGQLLSESQEITEEDKQLTTIIQRHSNRVNKIIEDILQLSRRKPSVRKKIHLSEWLKDYFKHFILENSVDDGNFKLNIASDDLFILMDPSHLKQIMDNLCINALKYGQPEVQPIIISAAMSGQTPIIDVVDSGPGISKTNQQHLFEPFFTTSAQGTGLGLYISRELAELNQARLSYLLNADEKSCFRIQLLSAEETTIEI